MRHVFRFVGSQVNETLWEISGDELLHLRKVLRLQTGDKVEVTDLCGNSAVGLLGTISKSRAELICEGCYSEPPAKHPLVVGIGALKHGTLEDIVCPLVELGLEELHVFQQTHMDKARTSENSVLRLQKLAVSAVKQSKRSQLPKIVFHKTLRDFIKYTDCLTPTNKYVLDSDGSTPLIKSKISTGCTVVVIGGEAGLEEQDFLLLKQNNFQSCSLGLYTLRSTTAAICCVALLNLMRNEL